MNNKPVRLSVSIGGQFREDLKHIDNDIHVSIEGLVDMRWSPKHPRIVDGAMEDHEVMHLEVNSWFITDAGIDRMSNNLRNEENYANMDLGPTYSERLYSINVILAIMDFFGPDYPYEKRLFQYLEYYLADIFLYAFHEKNQDDHDPLKERIYQPGELRPIPGQVNRIFHGKTYHRPEFFEVLNKMLERVGM